MNVQTLFREGVILDEMLKLSLSGFLGAVAAKFPEWWYQSRRHITEKSESAKKNC